MIYSMYIGVKGQIVHGEGVQQQAVPVNLESVHISW